MAQPALDNQVGLDFLTSEPPEALLLSRGGLARIEPFLPLRVHALLKAQFEVFLSQVVTPVAQADTAEEALQRLNARNDVVAAISSSASRLLVVHSLHSEALGDELARLPERLAERLHPTTLSWLGRTHASTLEGAFKRSALSASRSLKFSRDFLHHLSSREMLSCLGSREFNEVAAARLFLEGLQMVLVAILEDIQDRQTPGQASGTTKALVDELWSAAYTHERALLRWMHASLEQGLLASVGARLGRPTNISQTVALCQNELETGVLFAKLTDEWHSATGHLSNPNKIIQHPAYRAVSLLGWPVVPHILLAIERDEPDLWGPALHKITGEEPPLPEGPEPLLERIGQAWLSLAKQRGWPVGERHAR